MDNKTITITAERTMSCNDAYSIHYCIVRDLDVVEPHTAKFRIDEKGRQK